MENFKKLRLNNTTVMEAENGFYSQKVIETNESTNHVTEFVYFNRKRVLYVCESYLVLGQYKGGIFYFI